MSAPFFFLVFFLASQSLAALEITEAELTRLETILTELQMQNDELKLSQEDLTISLQKAETSWRASVEEAQAVGKSRDRWRMTAVVGLTTSAVSILGFIVLLLIKGD
ncbi:MAG: hypothetical protein WC455_13655 [Dehalococcoidia bacterium]